MSQCHNYRKKLLPPSRIRCHSAWWSHMFWYHFFLNTFPVATKLSWDSDDPKLCTDMSFTVDTLKCLTSELLLTQSFFSRNSFSMWNMNFRFYSHNMQELSKYWFLSPSVVLIIAEERLLSVARCTDNFLRFKHPSAMTYRPSWVELQPHFYLKKSMHRSVSYKSFVLEGEWWKEIRFVKERFSYGLVVMFGMMKRTQRTSQTFSSSVK